ncbi:hypothetical protein D3C72_2076280 [compost metagenome]
MAFSNHFWHHYLRDDGQLGNYTNAMMALLRSLKSGGCFVYAPGLPPVEALLNRSGAYTVTQSPLGIRAASASVERFYVSRVTPR